MLQSPKPKRTRAKKTIRLKTYLVRLCEASPSRKNGCVSLPRKVGCTRRKVGGRARLRQRRARTRVPERRAFAKKQSVARLSGTRAHARLCRRRAPQRSTQPTFLRSHENDFSKGSCQETRWAKSSQWAAKPCIAVKTCRPCPIKSLA